MTKIFKKIDIVAILAFLVLAGGLFFMFFITSTNIDDPYAVIYVGGEEIHRFNIAQHEGQTIVIETDFGKNEIIFQNGRVSMYKADCPDHWCLTSRPVPGTLRTITCLPNRFVISIEGVERSGIDIWVIHGEGGCCG